jgi:hypothetical protein
MSHFQVLDPSLVAIRGASPYATLQRVVRLPKAYLAQSEFRRRWIQSSSMLKWLSYGSQIAVYN